MFPPSTSTRTITTQASHGNGYKPPSLDQTLTFPVDDDPFINATAGLDDIVEDAPVPSADIEAAAAPTASLLQFTGMDDEQRMHVLERCRVHQCTPL